MASLSSSCEFKSSVELISALYTVCDDEISNSLLAKLSRAIDPHLGYSIKILDHWRSNTSQSRQSLLPECWYCFVGPSERLQEINDDTTFTTLISSRISQENSVRKRWLAKLLFAARQISREKHWWLLFRDTFTGPVSHFLIEQLPINAVAVEHSTSKSWASWLSRLHQAAVQQVSDSRRISLYISPEISNQPDGIALDADRLSIVLPDRIHTLEVRPQGQIESLLAQRIESRTSVEPFDIQSYQIIGEKPSIPVRLRRDISLQWLLAESIETEESPDPNSKLNGTAIQAPIFPLGRWLAQFHKQQWSYLAHCTRAGRTAWPDNKNDSQWYQWLLRELPEDNSPFYTLSQIIKSQRLIAHTGLYRGDHAAVSFSEVSLPELLPRRRYRAHLKRWDWEPYGVMISRYPLQQIGCKSVIYGNEETWKQLSIDQQPWYQPSHSKDGKENWSEEREWRVLGDVRLRQLPWESIIFFVPTRREAYQLSRICSWSIGWLYEDNAQPI